MGFMRMETCNLRVVPGFPLILSPLKQSKTHMCNFRILTLILDGVNLKFSRLYLQHRHGYSGIPIVA